MKKIFAPLIAIIATIALLASTASAATVTLPQYATGLNWFGDAVIPAVVTISEADVADGSATIVITSEGYLTQIRSYPRTVKATQTVTAPGTYTVNAYCKQRTATIVVKVWVDGIALASRHYKCW